MHVSHIVTTTISSADLLRLHVEESATIHNCPCWGAFLIINVKENWDAWLMAKI